MKRKTDGFTTTEIVVGICCVMFLALVGILNAPSFMDFGKQDQARTETAAIAGYISEYEMEVGKYPDSLDKLKDSVGQYGPWLKEIPKDPYATKNANYQYQKNATSFIVFSVGKDGAASSSITGGIRGDDIGFVSH